MSGTAFVWITLCSRATTYLSLGLNPSAIRTVITSPKAVWNAPCNVS